MAHNLNNTNGKTSFFSVKEKAWHGLGQIVEGYPTSAEAIIHAGLNFHVEKNPLVTIYDGNTIEIPGKFATVRTDTKDILGVVGDRYEVLQNVEAFDFFDRIVFDATDIKYETAGALGKGETIFITAKMPDYMKVGTDDIIEKYLFLTTSHDGSKPTTVAFTPTRIVCNNTLNAAMRNMSMSMTVRHCENSRAKLNEYSRIINMVDSRSKEMEQLFNTWAKVRITDKEVRKLIEAAMNPKKETINPEESEASTAFKNTCDNIFEYAMSNSTQQLETTKGTVFGAYNAVTGYYQNVKSFKSEDDKVKSILLGGTAQTRTQIAFNLCNDFTVKGNSIFN